MKIQNVSAWFWQNDWISNNSYHLYKTNILIKIVFCYQMKQLIFLIFFWFSHYYYNEMLDICMKQFSVLCDDWDENVNSVDSHK